MSPWGTGSIYPQPRRSDHVDKFQSATRGEILVPDPFIWMGEETPEAKEELDSFIGAQESLVNECLHKNPNLALLRQAMHDSNQYRKHYAPAQYPDGKWYWFHTSGSDPQTPLVRSRDTKLPDPAIPFEIEGEMFFDPSALSEDGSAYLDSFDFSRCGKYFAYTVSQSGGDYHSAFMRRLDCPFTKDIDMNNDSGRFPEEITGIKISDLTFSPDSKGIFYQRLREKSRENDESQPMDAMVYYHRLGTNQSEDILIHTDPDHRSRLFSMKCTDDGTYLVLTSHDNHSAENTIWVVEFDPNNLSQKMPWIKLQKDWTSENKFICNIGTTFYIQTSDSAPQNRVVTIDITDKSLTKTELIPQRDDAMLEDIRHINKHYFIATYKGNGITKLHVLTLTGEIVSIVAEGFLKSISVISLDYQSWFFATLEDFTAPNIRDHLKYDFNAQEDQRITIYRSTAISGLEYPRHSDVSRGGTPGVGPQTTATQQASQPALQAPSPFMSVPVQEGHVRSQSIRNSNSGNVHETRLTNAGNRTIHYYNCTFYCCRHEDSPEKHTHPARVYQPPSAGRGDSVAAYPPGLDELPHQSSMYSPDASPAGKGTQNLYSKAPSAETEDTAGLPSSGSDKLHHMDSSRSSHVLSSWVSKIRRGALKACKSLLARA